MKRHPGGVATKNRRTPADERRQALRSEARSVAVDPVILQKMKKSEIQQLLTDEGIPFTTKITKDGLIEMLVGRVNGPKKVWSPFPSTSPSAKVAA